MECAVTDRAWAIARRHVPYFETCFAPNRAAILAAVKEALQAPPVAVLPDPGTRLKLDELTHEVRAGLTGTHVRIWSGEHGAYWRPASSGYTREVTAAGVYEFSDAWRRTKHCGPEKRIALEPVPAAEARVS